MIQSEHSPENILIIGSGIGGLSTGIILSTFGYRVTVVEKKNMAGGLMRSYRRGGIDCPTGVHYLGALSDGQPLRRLWDYLGVTHAIPLERMGTEGIVDRYIFDDFVFEVPDGLEAFEANLRTAFPAEGKQISTIMTDLRETTRTLERLEAVLSPAMGFLTLEQLQPMGERLREMGCSERLTSVLSVPATLIGVPLRDCPAMFYYMTLAAYLMSSWRLADSSQTMVEAFISRFRALGGEIVTADGVEALQVAGGRVRGAVLQSGRILPATTVIAAIHPKALIPLLPPEAVKASYAERAAAIVDTKGLFGVNVALRADEQPALSYNVYRLHPQKDGVLHRGGFYQLRPSGKPDITLLSMITTSPVDAWQLWEKTISGARGKDYDAAKNGMAERMIDEAQQLFGAFTKPHILDCYTPLTLRDWVGSPDGSPYGILRSAGQLLKAASLNRTPVKQLYIAGQNRLFPGIMGTILGSFQVAKQIIGPERFTQDIAGGFQ